MLCVQILSLLVVLFCGLGSANPSQDPNKINNTHHVDNISIANKDHTRIVKREAPRSENVQLELDIVVFHLGLNKTNDWTATTSPSEPTTEPNTEPTGTPTTPTPEPSTSPTTEPTTTPTPEPKIVIRANGDVYCSGVTFNDKVYFTSTDHNVYEYDPATGQQRIVVNSSESFYDSGVIFNNKLYFGDYYGKVYEYDPATDQQMEKFKVPGRFLDVATLLLSGKLYLISWINDYIFELDLVTGEQKQIISIEEIDLPSNGVILNDKIYFSEGQGNEAKVFEYDPMTGEKRAVIVAGRGFYRGIVLNDTIYFPTVAENIYEYNPKLEKTQIAFTIAAKGGMAFDDKLYFRTEDGLIECDPTTGREERVISDKIESNGLILNDKLYFGGRGKVFEYDPVTGQHKVVIKTNELAYFVTTGVVSSGKLYIGSSDDKVYAYDPSTN